MKAFWTQMFCLSLWYRWNLTLFSKHDCHIDWNIFGFLEGLICSSSLAHPCSYRSCLKGSIPAAIIICLNKISLTKIFSSQLPHQIATASAKMSTIQILGLFWTPIFIFTTLVWIKYSVHIFLLMEVMLVKRNSRPVDMLTARLSFHRSIISGEICLSWKKNSLTCSHHLLDLDHCQTSCHKQILRLSSFINTWWQKFDRTPVLKFILKNYATSCA